MNFFKVTQLNQYIISITPSFHSNAIYLIKNIGFYMVYYSI